MKNILIVGVIVVGIVAFLIFLGSGLDPGENVPGEEEVVFFDAVVQMAAETETIAIDSSCIFSPMVIKIEQGTSLVWRNNDSLEHVVFTFIDQRLKIPGQDSGSMEVLSPEGIYGAQCDGVHKGFILVSPKE